jgi:uncharacterized protein YkwD
MVLRQVYESVRKVISGLLVQKILQMVIDTEAEVIATWIKSAGHCANLMNKRYVEMGVGREGSYWTQTFGAQ